MRFCIKCKFEKGFHEFNKWYKKSGRQGYRTTCKECEHRINKEYRKNNFDKLKINRRQRLGQNERKICTDPEKRKENERSYRSQKKYPEKRRARQKLHGLLKTGKMFRPDRCSICFKIGKVEAHHNDYTKPEIVDWVCKGCHTHIHYGIKE